MNPIELKPTCRILVTRTDRIGDLVLSTPVFTALRRRFPQAWIACVTFSENRELVEGHPDLNEVILYDKKGREKGLLGNFLFAERLKSKKFDAVIHLHATNRMHWTGWLAGIPARIGWKRKSAWTLTHALPDIKKEGKQHESEYNFELLRFLGIEKPAQIEPYFPPNERARLSLEELLRHHGVDQDRPRVILSPAASCVSKRWPAERFGYLAEQLVNRYGVQILITGSAEDAALAAKIGAAANIELCDLTGRLSLGMLGELFKQSALLISNDSGPVHIAAAVGTPVISIFGRKQAGLSPARWRPLGIDTRVVWKDVGCETCLAHNCQIHFLCLDSISVDEVLHAVNALTPTLSHREREHRVNVKPFPSPAGRGQGEG